MKHIPLLALQTVLAYPLLAQSGRISHDARRMDENTRIFDKATGRRVTLREFSELLKSDQYGQHLEPGFNEYGKVDLYTLRPTALEEKATHQLNDRDPALRPKVG